MGTPLVPSVPAAADGVFHFDIPREALFFPVTEGNLPCSSAAVDDSRGDVDAAALVWDGPKIRDRASEGEALVQKRQNRWFSLPNNSNNLLSFGLAQTQLH